MPTAQPSNSSKPGEPQVEKGTGFLRALGLSLLVHALLIAALTWGVNWRREALDTTVQAELWAANVQQAAPIPVSDTLPAVQEKPQPVPPPGPKPVPVVNKLQKPQAVPPTDVVDPQIAIEKAKKLKAQKEQLIREQHLKEAQQARELERQQIAQAEKRAKEAKEAQLAKEKARATQERDKQEKLEKTAQAKAEKERLAKKEAEQQEKVRKDLSKLEAAKAQATADKSRLDALKRMNQLAGQGGANDVGKDKQTAAPSEGYLGRIAGRIKPNVVYTGDKNAGIVATFEVRLNTDGRVISIQMLASSGVRAWDEAAHRAIDKTEVFPLDGGRVHSPLTIRMTPRD